MSAVFKLIYSPKYYINLGTHVFPTDKYPLIYNRLLREALFKKEDFISPEPAREEELLLVHTSSYVRKLLEGKLTTMDIMKLELPYSQELVEVSKICVEGTIRCCEAAIEDGIAVHVGGGFHHAFPGHGEGFCVFNDIAIGIRKMQKDDLLRKVLVIDCDLHQGNGTAAIFKDKRDVFTFSIHQENNYPFEKPSSDIDIGLCDGVGDKEYLTKLNQYIPKVIDEFQPELIVYVAGADPYKNDRLGGLSLSIEGLKRRDEFIFGLCRKDKIPVASVLAGGYAMNVRDTVAIHYNMIKTAKELWK